MSATQQIKPMKLLKPITAAVLIAAYLAAPLAALSADSKDAKNPEKAKPYTLKTCPVSGEKLETWQEAIEFADLVYNLTRGFPADERFGLTNQMRRAAVSISSNLAEGSSRSSRSDFARFVEIGTGSLFEVVSQSFIGRRQGFLTEEQFQRLYAAAEKQGKMLSGLRNSLLEAQR